MNWWYVLEAWLFIGFVAVACAMYRDHNEADDFTLEDLGMVFVTICTGPIFAVWFIKEIASDVVLIKGKQDER